MMDEGRDRVRTARGLPDVGQIPGMIHPAQRSPSGCTAGCLAPLSIFVAR
jgi:hypothetical protein